MNLMLNSHCKNNYNNEIKKKREKASKQKKKERKKTEMHLPGREPRSSRL